MSFGGVNPEKDYIHQERLLMVIAQNHNHSLAAIANRGLSQAVFQGKATD